MPKIPGGWHRALLIICVVFILVHCGLFLFDLSDPAAFLRGDRAVDRMQKITGVLTANSDALTGAILNAGAPGDFLQHAALFGLGGRYLVIAVQIALELLVLVLTTLATARLTESVSAALVAGLLVLIMPGSLLNPHVLTTEVWFAAVLTVATLLVCLSFNEEGELTAEIYLYAGFVGFALASCIRPQGLLVAVVLAASLSVTLANGRRYIVSAAALSYLLFPLSWMIARQLSVGEFGIGGSDAGLGVNLAIRAERILSLPVEFAPSPIGLSAFMHIATTHPFATLSTVRADLFNLIFNPGSNHVFGYYLSLWPTAKYDNPSWLNTGDRSGIFGIVLALTSQSGLFLSLFVIWTAIQITVLSGLGMAFFRAIRKPGKTPRWVWVVAMVIVTILASALGSGILRWDHRAGVEPLMALMAAWGLFGQKSRTIAEPVSTPTAE